MPPAKIAPKTPNPLQSAFAAGAAPAQTAGGMPPPEDGAVPKGPTPEEVKAADAAKTAAAAAGRLAAAAAKAKAAPKAKPGAEAAAAAAAALAAASKPGARSRSGSRKRRERAAVVEAAARMPGTPVTHLSSSTKFKGLDSEELAGEDGVDMSDDDK